MNKKAVTDKQRLANQRNAARSTGPKTPEGKQVAARNALKHGLLAQSVVIDSDAAPESREEFDALLADFVADLKPTGVVEETLVERIATCYWRIGREITKRRRGPLQYEFARAAECRPFWTRHRPAIDWPVRFGNGRGIRRTRNLLRSRTGIQTWPRKRKNHPAWRPGV